MFTTRCWVWAAVGLISPLLGCETDAEPPARLDMGLPDDSPLNEVPPAELEEACQSIERSLQERFSLDRSFELACTFRAVMIGSTEESCVTLRDVCLSEIDLEACSPVCPYPIDILAVECASMGASSCSATAAEVETCLNSTLADIDRVIRAMSCGNAANVTDESLPAGLSSEPMSDQRVEFRFSLAPSCDIVEQRCPGSIRF